MTNSDVMNYAAKDQSYFNGERSDFIDRIPSGRKFRFLEIGCGDGANANYAKRLGKCNFYVGVELFQAAAERAKEYADKIYLGDVEKVTFEPADGPFDVLIMSEVLEHLVDPWSLLKRLHPMLAPDAYVFASSPAISHFSTILMLLRGGWDLTDHGRMDRTHLRWFTPRTYAQMFRDCGYRVEDVRPVNGLSKKQSIAKALLPARLGHLFISQVAVMARPA